MNKKIMNLVGICFLFVFFSSLISASSFNSTWNTSKISAGSSNSTTITLPLESDGVYDFTVDWGDGNVTIVTTYDSSNATHDYQAEGSYNLTISGTIQGFRFSYGGDRLKIMDIYQWGDLNLGNSNGYFFGCSNLDVSATDVLNLTGTTNLQNMFLGASSFNGNISNWNVSSVTNMESMFRSSAFNQNISSWDVSSVTDMESMFQDATDFNGNISNWNVSNVETMYYAFFGASSFNQDLNSWDVSSVTTIYGMFESASAFNQNISSWNVSSVTDMYGVFYSNPAFNQDINSWDVSSVTTMDDMFYSASAFNQNISSWNVSSVTDMSDMFESASAFNQNISSWDVSSVTDMHDMFRSATDFNGNISNWNVSSVTDMKYMFRSASSFNQDLNSWDVSNVINMYYMFSWASVFNQDLNSWDVSKVTNMYGMFQSDLAFNGDISNWDVSNVTTMGSMFHSTVFNQDIGSWNVSGVTNMGSMLYGVTLSTTNYDNLLIGWASLPSLQDSVSFHGGNSQYSAGATSSRNGTLIGVWSWTITDGGLTQVPASINLTLGGVQGNNSINAGESINLNCSTISGDSGAYLVLYNNGTLINNGTSPIGNTTLFSTMGDYNITCVYETTTNYTSSSETWWVNITEALDTTAPTIILTSPPTGSQDTDGVVRFTFTPSDANTIDNCSLIYQGGVYTTSTSISNGVSNVIEVSSIGEGHQLFMDDLQWRIDCTDEFGNTGSSTTNHLDTNPNEVLGGGNGGTYVPPPKNPKNIDLFYSEVWERNSEEKLIMKIYNQQDELYEPPIIKTNFTIEGVEYKKLEFDELNQTVLTFEVSDVAELGTHLIDLTIIDQRTITRTIGFKIVEEGAEEVEEEVEEDRRNFLIIIGGVFLLMILIAIIIFAVTKSNSSKTQTF